VFRNAVFAAATAFAVASFAPQAAAAESDELRAEVAALKKRIDQMEAGAKAQSVPAWVNRLTWKSDLRFRNETINLQYAPERNRFRIRARAGLEAKVNDSIRMEFALATTEGGDPRASNQTLTGENSRKPILLDLAYAEWAPAADWKLTAGKMRIPLIRPGQSTFIDVDVNPEGLAAAWTHGDFFGVVLYNVLEERAAADESTMLAGQFAWRPRLGPGRFSLGAGYSAFQGVRGRSPFHNNSSNGNSTTSVTADCVDTVPCLANDYDLLQLFTEWSQPLGGRPLALYADFSHNTSAENGLDTAWTAGISWGKAAEPLTWEVGFAWLDIEKDALYAQFLDSDFGSGVTDARGAVLRAGFAPARNWVINLSWFLTECNVDVPVTVAGVGSVEARNSRRLQLDLNFKF
jgi:hypothetical protein